MKSGINILKKSFDNVHSETIRLIAQRDQLQNELNELQKQIELFSEQAVELNNCIEKLEGTTSNEQAPPQAKKAKRKSSNS